ncbi:hypothetical protein [Methyloglobulus sp.]|uniref:hypothetical protein n=1 Tax=Methyloglobulus sp. TaxID=2518622 RepID=UPI00398A3188
MKTLQFRTHIENNAQLHLTLPSEYANQDVDLVVIIQPRQEAEGQQDRAIAQNTASHLFSERWQGQFKLNDKADDARMDYLKQRYQL